MNNAQRLLLVAGFTFALILGFILLLPALMDEDLASETVKVTILLLAADIAWVGGCFLLLDGWGSDDEA